MKPGLTQQELACRLMISPETVRQWIQKGDLVAETVPGGYQRFLREEVEHFRGKKDCAAKTYKQ